MRGSLRRQRSLSRFVSRDLSERIVREFQPERIILFGSSAYGQPPADSDVDLLVVLPFEGRGFRKSLEILHQSRRIFP